MKLLNLLLSLFLCTVVSCQKQAELQVTYIPEGLTGAYFIVYDYAEGEPKEYNKEGERVYRIPQNGILYTQFPPSYGVFMPQLYYVDSLGNPVKEIKSFYTEQYWDRLNEGEVYSLEGHVFRFTDKTGNWKEIVDTQDGKVVSRSTDKGKVTVSQQVLGYTKYDEQKLELDAISIIDSIQKYYPEKYNPLKEEDEELEEK